MPIPSMLGRALQFSMVDSLSKSLRSYSHSFHLPAFGFVPSKNRFMVESNTNLMARLKSLGGMDTGQDEGREDQHCHVEENDCQCL